MSPCIQYFHRWLTNTFHAGLQVKLQALTVKLISSLLYTVEQVTWFFYLLWTHDGYTLCGTQYRNDRLGRLISGLQPRHESQPSVLLACSGHIVHLHQRENNWVKYLHFLFAPSKRCDSYVHDGGLSGQVLFISCFHSPTSCLLFCFSHPECPDILRHHKSSLTAVPPVAC